MGNLKVQTSSNAAIFATVILTHACGRQSISSFEERNTLCVMFSLIHVCEFTFNKLFYRVIKTLKKFLISDTCSCQSETYLDWQMCSLVTKPLSLANGKLYFLSADTFHVGHPPLTTVPYHPHPFLVTMLYHFFYTVGGN